jgi:hypothetical protein
MATLYWRGAIDNDVQKAGNWTLLRPGVTASAPPAAPNTPAAGDSVIFADFVVGGWNPPNAPWGLIGSGVTHTVLNQLTLEPKFARQVGAGHNFLKAYANVFNLFKTDTSFQLGQGLMSDKIFIKSLNSSASINLGPYDLYNSTPKYYISGYANGLFFQAPTNRKAEVFLGSYHPDASLITESGSRAVTITTGINTYNVSKMSYTVHIGKDATLGGDNSFIQGRDNCYVWIEKGVSMEHLEVSSFPSLNSTLKITFDNTGSEYGQTGALGRKTSIGTFYSDGANYSQFNGVDSSYPNVILNTGISFDNFYLKGTSKVEQFASFGELVFIKNYTHEISPYETIEGMKYPLVYLSSAPDSFAIGGANETGGGNIKSAFGVSGDYPPSIFVNANIEIDIV